MWLDGYGHGMCQSISYYKHIVQGTVIDSEVLKTAKHIRASKAPTQRLGWQLATVSEF